MFGGAGDDGLTVSIPVVILVANDVCFSPHRTAAYY